MLRLAVLVATVAVVSSSVIPVRPERKVADADSLKKYKQVLDLLVGLGHNDHYKDEHADWDITANYASFTDEKYPREFWTHFQQGTFPKHKVFSLSCHHTRRETFRLFDLFYFAKDFDTFIKAASWARNRVNAGMFAYAYTLAVYHRKDTNAFTLPPWYEIIPSLFVPADTLHHIYTDRMTGVKEGRYNYNNTGYEASAHKSMFGGVFGSDRRGHGEYRISYFREDVGLNNFLTDWMHSNPSWMCPTKYGLNYLNRRGENFYYLIQQLYARYTLERLANGLPFNGQLAWRKPVRVGYNPRVSYINGVSMYPRPDYFVPYDHNIGRVSFAETIETRLWDTIDFGLIKENSTIINLNAENGMEILGRLVYGTNDRVRSRFYQSLYYNGLDALAYGVSTGSDRFLIGGALSTPATALRDPLYYDFIGKLLLMFQHYKRNIGPYSHEELHFDGVTVQNIEVDRLMTYFDLYDYEVTNGVPMVKSHDYNDHRYVARQYRLNHKPYRYNITVNSNKAGDAIVRVFIGPKYDSDDHQLTLEQARMAYVEIDRFPVQMTAGVNVWERSSKESPIFVEDLEGFRSLYTRINDAINQKGEFYTREAGHCGLPERLQIPMGWRGGRAHVLSVIVMPFDQSEAGNAYGADIACGGNRLYDRRPMGFPFDRPTSSSIFESTPNIFFKDVLIHHRDQADINRPSV